MSPYFIWKASSTGVSGSCENERKTTRRSRQHISFLQETRAVRWHCMKDTCKGVKQNTTTLARTIAQGNKTHTKGREARNTTSARTVRLYINIVWCPMFIET